MIVIEYYDNDDCVGRNDTDDLCGADDNTDDDDRCSEVDDSGDDGVGVDVNETDKGFDCDDDTSSG